MSIRGNEVGRLGIYTFVVAMGGTLVNWRTNSQTQARLQLPASPYPHDTNMIESTQSTSALLAVVESSILLLSP